MIDSSNSSITDSDSQLGKNVILTSAVSTADSTESSDKKTIETADSSASTVAVRAKKTFPRRITSFSKSNAISNIKPREMTEKELQELSSIKKSIESDIQSTLKIFDRQIALLGQNSLLKPTRSIFLSNALTICMLKKLVDEYYKNNIVFRAEDFENCSLINPLKEKSINLVNNIVSNINKCRVDYNVDSSEFTDVFNKLEHINCSFTKILVDDKRFERNKSNPLISIINFINSCSYSEIVFFLKLVSSNSVEYNLTDLIMKDEVKVLSEKLRHYRDNNMTKDHINFSTLNSLISNLEKSRISKLSKSLKN